MTREHILRKEGIQLRPESMKMLPEYLLPNRMDELSNSCCRDLFVAREKIDLFHVYLLHEHLWICLHT